MKMKKLLSMLLALSLLFALAACGAEKEEIQPQPAEPTGGGGGAQRSEDQRLFRVSPHLDGGQAAWSGI